MILIEKNLPMNSKHCDQTQIDESQLMAMAANHSGVVKRNAYDISVAALKMLYRAIKTAKKRDKFLIFLKNIKKIK